MCHFTVEIVSAQPGGKIHPCAGENFLRILADLILPEGKAIQHGTTRYGEIERLSLDIKTFPRVTSSLATCTIYNRWTDGDQIFFSDLPQNILHDDCS